MGWYEMKMDQKGTGPSGVVTHIGSIIGAQYTPSFIPLLLDADLVPSRPTCLCPTQSITTGMDRPC